MSAKVNTQTTIHQGRVFNLVTENITLENGVTIDVDIIHHPGAAAIVALSEDNEVILIRQYRHAIGSYIWEIPAGTLDPHEHPEKCAQRELMEETGYAAHNFEKLGEIIPVPGYSDERIHIFVATDLMAVRQKLDADELLEVHEIKIARVMEMMSNGSIQDSKTLTGLFMTMQWLRNKKD